MGGNLPEAAVGLEPKFQVQRDLSDAKLVSVSLGRAAESSSRPGLKRFFTVPMAQLSFHLSFLPSPVEDGEQLLGKRC